MTNKGRILKMESDAREGAGAEALRADAISGGSIIADPAERKGQSQMLGRGSIAIRLP